jgi:hypothetical protein
MKSVIPSQKRSCREERPRRSRARLRASGISERRSVLGNRRKSWATRSIAQGGHRPFELFGIHHRGQRHVQSQGHSILIFPGSIGVSHRHGLIPDAHTVRELARLEPSGMLAQNVDRLPHATLRATHVPATSGSIPPPTNPLEAAAVIAGQKLRPGPPPTGAAVGSARSRSSVATDGYARGKASAPRYPRPPGPGDEQPRGFGRVHFRVGHRAFAQHQPGQGHPFRGLHPSRRAVPTGIQVFRATKVRRQLDHPSGSIPATVRANDREVSTVSPATIHSGCDTFGPAGLPRALRPPRGGINKPEPGNKPTARPPAMRYSLRPVR